MCKPGEALLVECVMKILDIKIMLLLLPGCGQPVLFGPGDSQRVDCGAVVIE